jgi:type I site-specific restriction-modification system R (restriction) subunit
MKQAIQERFILDVLAHYTPVKSYYKLIKKVEDDPEFDVKKAQKKLRRFVEGHQHAIRLKAEMMVDHFHMKNSDKQNARIEHDKALVRVMTALIQDDTELFKQFSDNESFRRWLSNMVFALTYGEPGSAR